MIIVFRRAAIITRLAIFEPRNGLVARKPAQIHISEIGNPSFIPLHRSTVERPSLSNAETLVVASGQSVVELAVCFGEACAAGGVIVHADHVEFWWELIYCFGDISDIL